MAPHYAVAHGRQIAVIGDTGWRGFDDFELRIGRFNYLPEVLTKFSNLHLFSEQLYVAGSFGQALAHVFLRFVYFAVLTMSAAYL